jgi:hypothetical protein
MYNDTRGSTQAVTDYTRAAIPTAAALLAKGVTPGTPIIAKDTGEIFFLSVANGVAVLEALIGSGATQAGTVTILAGQTVSPAVNIAGITAATGLVLLTENQAAPDATATKLDAHVIDGSFTAVSGAAVTADTRLAYLVIRL